MDRTQEKKLWVATIELTSKSTKERPSKTITVKGMVHASTREFAKQRALNYADDVMYHEHKGKTEAYSVKVSNVIESKMKFLLTGL